MPSNHPQKQTIKKVIACLFCILGLSSPYLAMKYGPQVPKDIPPPTIEEKFKPQISTTIGEPQKTISILFIGSSLISYVDMPGMLINIASSDSTNHVRIEASTETIGGSNLEDQIQQGDAFKYLLNHHFDFVFMQETSGWMWSEPHFQRAYAAVRKWDAVIRKTGGTPLLMETWSDKAGSLFYLKTSPSPEVFQEIISRRISDLGDYYKIPVVKIGSYWEYVRHLPGAPDLFAADGHHPGATGTYLGALVLYRYLTGNKPANVTFVPPYYIKPEEAKFLRDVVSQ